MLPVKQLGHQKDKKEPGVTKHIEKQFQKNFVPGRDIVIDDPTTGFKLRIIFETYNNNKKNKWGIKLFALAESDTVYVRSIIPNYGKLTGDM
jgi:ribosome biogenesis GTPase A